MTITEIGPEYLLYLDSNGLRDSRDKKFMTTPKKSRGAQAGNQNRNASFDEALDGQLLVKLPRERLPRLRAATYVTGDRGISALVRRLIDAELLRVERLSEKKDD